VHLSSLLSSSEPMKQFGVPSHRCDNSKSCSTVVDSLTWHPKYPSSRFRKKISRLIPKPTPPWLLACKKREKHMLMKLRKNPVRGETEGWKSPAAGFVFYKSREEIEALNFPKCHLAGKLRIIFALTAFFSATYQTWVQFDFQTLIA
jgi:hypothetical protein